MCTVDLLPNVFNFYTALAVEPAPKKFNIRTYEHRERSYFWQAMLSGTAVNLLQYPARLKTYHTNRTELLKIFEIILRLTSIPKMCQLAGNLLDSSQHFSDAPSACERLISYDESMIVEKSSRV